MKTRHILSLFFLPLLAASCQVTYVTPVAVAQPKRMDFAPDQSVKATQKTFALQHDWQYGTWTMRKGAMITFNEDGTGHFNGTLYSQNVSEAPEEVHLQSVQYGPDGNALFLFPGADVGFPMHIRSSSKDQICDSQFGFDKRYFPMIQEAKFYARSRLNGMEMGPLASRKATKFGW